MISTNLQTFLCQKSMPKSPELWGKFFRTTPRPFYVGSILGDPSALAVINHHISWICLPQVALNKNFSAPNRTKKSNIPIPFLPNLRFKNKQTNKQTNAGPKPSRFFSASTTIHPPVPFPPLPQPGRIAP